MILLFHQNSNVGILTLFCRDRRFDGSQEEFEACLRNSTTVYVGNLSFYTTEDQMYEVRTLIYPSAASHFPFQSHLHTAPPFSFQVFSKTGDIKRIIMGLDKNQKTPCGFCFVVYYTRREAEDCVKYINGTMLDDRPIRVDFDWGFMDGRQFGRGRTGGQVRDEYRMDYDPGRGGYGTILKQEIGTRQQMIQMMQEEMTGGDVGGYRTLGPTEKRFRGDESDDER